MADFDINKELEVVNINENLHEITINVKNSNYDFGYFYHAHRLGTRVPLFVIVSGSANQLILYFCKIGNVLSIKTSPELEEDSELFCQFLSTLLRRFGSNHGIMIRNCDDSVNSRIVTAIENSPFLQSEINCAVQLCDGNKKMTDKSDGINFISVPKVNDSDLQNALILERVQRKLKLPCLDWAWQYEQSDNLFLCSKLVFKNLEKWKNTNSRGSAVEGTRIIPMKLIRDKDEEHSPEHILDLFPDLGLIIDLSNDEGSYDKSKFSEKHIEYKRIQIQSKVIPSSTDVFQFICLVNDFKTREPNRDIIVHCHYGYNRTGLMICAYLIEEEHVTVQEAFRRFRSARPPGIKHQNYIDKLILRYSDYTMKP